MINGWKYYNEEAENKLFEGQENKDNTEKKEDENVLLTVQPEKKKTIRKKWNYIILELPLKNLIKLKYSQGGDLTRRLRYYIFHSFFQTPI